MDEIKLALLGLIGWWCFASGFIVGALWFWWKFGGKDEQG